ncbi:hypothetical protein [Microtetraspora malaysiensis]|uniref:hypothetical protein n=1 Tax=Microtetraspora malaysiensis TaxID=161358 RepID=UPI003D8D1E28
MSRGHTPHQPVGALFLLSPSTQAGVCLLTAEAGSHLSRRRGHRILGGGNDGVEAMASIHQTADLVVDAVALGLQEYECGWGARAPGVDAGQKFADLLTWQATRAKLTAFHEKHPEYGYSIHFDAAKDATVVTGNLPKSLAEELRTTAGKVILEMADGNTVREDIGHFPANEVISAK